MKYTFKISLAFIVSSMMLFTGCQSGFLTKPDLGKLAFWKNDQIRLAAKNEDIPPPSRHFSPDPGEGSETRNELKSNIDGILAKSKQEGSATKQEGSETKTEPIRKPYGLASAKPQGSDKKSSPNDFELNKKLDQIHSKTNQALSATEKAIGNANSFVSKTTQNIKSASNAFSGSANSFAGWQNKLKTSGENQIQKVANEFKNQASQTVSYASNSINQLTSNAKTSVGNSIANVTNSLDNAFKPDNVISNDYFSRNKSTAGKPQESDTAKNESPATSAQFQKNEFGSKYKQVAEQFGKPNVGQSLNSSSIQQSSFNTEVESGATEKQLVAAASPTKYPSTSFGKFKPIAKPKPKSEDETFKIPPQLLRGSSSFSPGSVKPLRPVETGK